MKPLLCRILVLVFTAAWALTGLAAPGDVEAGFSPNANQVVLGPAMQSDGKIVIGGDFDIVSWGTRNKMARINADGTLDAGFDPNVGGGAVYSVVVQTDGKIVIAGAFTSVGGTMRNRMARLNADGTLDGSFNPNLNGTVFSMAVQPDGKFIIGGGFSTVGGTSRSLIARLNANGTLDTGFTPSLSAPVYTTAVQSDGKILIGGAFSSVTGVTRNFIARLNADGTLDTGFNANVDGGAVASIAIQADGKIVIGGNLTTVGGVTRNRIARVNSTGSLDTGFNANVTGEVDSIALSLDGKMVIGGNISSVGGVARNFLARLNPDGSLITSFNPNPDDWTPSAILQADGKIIPTGGFTLIGGVTRYCIARLDNDPAIQSLTIPSSSRVQWLRSGAAPDTQHVTFELSTDGGSNWTALGSGTRIAGGWEKTGLSLPSSGTLRARARTTGGYTNSSSGLVESVTSITPAPTITSISPNPVPASNSPQVVKIHGTDFVSKPTVTLTWTGQPDYTVPAGQITFISATQFEMLINVQLDQDNWTAKVTNPDGRQSNTVGFQVIANLPLTPGPLETQSFSNRVELGWVDNATNETGFKIERRTGAGAFTQIATTGASAGTAAYYTDNTTSPRTTYTYRVRAYNATGDSGYTNEVTSTTPGGPPGAFTLSNDAPVWDASIPGPKVQLNWTPSFDVGNYAVYRNGTVYQAGIAGTAYLNSANLTGGATYTYFIRASNADGTTDSNTVTVTMPTGPATAPEIVVESPLNTNIADGGSKSFGSVVVGANTSLTFTIKNSGTANLTGLAITKNGTDAEMFSITSYPTAPVSAPSGSTTFTVKFTPTSAGSKSAAIHITNNDSDENPFDVTLTGTGYTPALPTVGLVITGPTICGTDSSVQF